MKRTNGNRMWEERDRSKGKMKEMVESGEEVASPQGSGEEARLK